MTHFILIPEHNFFFLYKSYTCACRRIQASEELCSAPYENYYIDDIGNYIPEPAPPQLIPLPGSAAIFAEPQPPPSQNWGDGINAAFTDASFDSTMHPFSPYEPPNPPELLLSQNWEDVNIPLVDAPLFGWMVPPLSPIETSENVIGDFFHGNEE